MNNRICSLREIRWNRIAAVGLLLFVASATMAQTEKPAAAHRAASIARPKLVVMIVVDQMRADYVDKFRNQWKGGLRRLVDEGAWFREAAYPFAATETCVGHSTVSTGAFPMNHGMVANGWWDRDAQKMVTCTDDDNVKNTAYAGGTTKGGDSAVRMRLPAYAEELKYQSGGATRIVTFSLKARAAITLAGHKADGVTWFDTGTGAWVTSSPYSTQDFIEDYVEKHPVTEDYGKTWALFLPQSRYFYEDNATGAATIKGWTTSFPHSLHGKDGGGTPDEALFNQWAASPYADTYLTKLAETAVDALALGKGAGTDYLGVAYSTPDHAGHTFGPHSWEIQDILVRLDRDLGELFTHLDRRIGQGNYIVALTADHGVAPIPADMQKIGFDANVLNLAELKERIEDALEPFNFPKPAIAHIGGNETYFAKGVYDRLRREPPAMKAVLDAALSTPGVATVLRAEELNSGAKSVSHMRTAAALSFLAERSGDLYVLQQPYWLTAGSAESAKRSTGTGHGTPYYYDQRVPILFMGYRIQPGQYFGDVTPADIAPTFAALTGVTLAVHDGRVLSEAIQKHGLK
jgi:predicted AlkP superfamily pyrophosphatase or phosphodiesterase